MAKIGLEREDFGILRARLMATVAAGILANPAVTLAQESSVVLDSEIVADAILENCGIKSLRNEKI